MSHGRHDIDAIGAMTAITAMTAIFSRARKMLSGSLLYLLALGLGGFLLTGCASTIRSDVIAFHEWPAELPDRSFTFSRTPEQAASLEYRMYEDQVRNELSRLGFIPDVDRKGSALTVALSYGMRMAQVVVTEPAYDPFWYGPGFYPGWGWRRGRYPYDPYWGPPMRQTAYPIYSRSLHVVITRTAEPARPLYEVEVVSEGENGNLSEAMPYMIRSAFDNFPGQSGVLHSVKLKVEPR